VPKKQERQGLQRIQTAIVHLTYQGGYIVNKSELVTAVAEKSGLSKKAASEAVEAVLETISQALATGEKVTLVGFGTFEVRHRAARKGVNPATGAPIDIPATVVPAFKAGKNLKEAVAK
jgi:DNA-binding protein HU-beta